MSEDLGFIKNGVWRSYADLREENERLREALQRADALISWVDGMCVDEADHMVIREGINRYNARRAAGQADTGCKHAWNDGAPTICWEPQP